MKKNNSVLLSAPYIVFMVVFTLIPLGVVAYYALTDPATGAFTLENVKDLGEYMPVLWQSILYSLVSALICLLLGYPVAYYIAHRTPLMQKILYMLVMLPMCMSFLLRTLAWVGLLQDTGIINDFLEFIGIGRLQLIRTPGAVVLGMVYNYLPYMILPLYSTIVKINPRLIEAAEDLGCNSVQVFGRVILPSGSIYNPYLPMYCTTPSGTRYQTGLPAATRSRQSVEEIAIAGISIRETSSDRPKSVSS